MPIPNAADLAHIIAIEAHESLEDLCETLAIGENPAADMQSFLRNLSEGVAKAIISAIEMACTEEA